MVRVEATQSEEMSLEPKEKPTFITALRDQLKIPCPYFQNYSGK